MTYKMQKSRESIDKQQDALVEKCVICGNFTPYLHNTPISFREYYIEGGGQLCETCYNMIYKETTK